MTGSAGHGFIRNWSSHLVCVGPLAKSASKHLQPIYNGAIGFARRCWVGPMQSGTRPLARRGATPRLGRPLASTGPISLKGMRIRHGEPAIEIRISSRSRTGRHLSVVSPHGVENV